MNEKATVLVVDDSATNIQVLAGILKNDYLVKVANSGQRCLDILTAGPLPDLLLLDIDMPDMDGYEVCRRVKADSDMSKIPIIFVTGMDSDDNEEYGLTLGAVDYITKPIRPAIVQARVKTQVMLKKQSDKLTFLAFHDQLTSVYNRYFMLEVAGQKVARTLRDGHSLSLLLLDIDHFKQVNDQHGHLVGDQVLVAMAQKLMEFNRKDDLVARFGGEEFIVLLDFCDKDSAVKKAEILRQAIEDLMPAGLKVTVSIGIAELRSGKESFNDMLKRADSALYQAKEQGRNRVVVAID
ncbi:response regulator receiver modulated diguanylate cyclase [Oceanospirillum multiglobuliferum]|uniref:diguanylate cyclase n=1 Tax=Oceanospirillum multiglobuliferum TaxID=64969 RepID=A0A1T4PTJ1_9GAMM|nr:diguanylate cyclase [Oceanospirillum multiglobuliferum]OPX55327.1 diguanylate cyclase response regulator [Oceanospirillum multiglobuliferum]SJZ94759.1 response regulator receiver modulated diguanylate cyclase [Oceanospirillum multiglobuliferum]